MSKQDLCLLSSQQTLFYDPLEEEQVRSTQQHPLVVNISSELRLDVSLWTFAGLNIASEFQSNAVLY